MSRGQDPEAGGEGERRGPVEWLRVRVARGGKKVAGTNLCDTVRIFLVSELGGKLWEGAGQRTDTSRLPLNRITFAAVLRMD